MENPVSELDKILGAQTVSSTPTTVSNSTTSASSSSVFENNYIETYGAYDSANDTKFDAEGYDRRREAYYQYYKNNLTQTTLSFEEFSELSTAQQINLLTATGKQNNANQEHIINGKSEEAYDAYQQILAEVYGIETDYNYHESVAVSMATSISHDSRYNEMKNEAQSFDSVLDLILIEKFSNYVKEHYNGHIPNWDSLLNNQKALNEAGMALIQTNDRKYSLALIDDKGNIIQDEDGNLGQVFLSDYLMPDGLAQNNEIRVAEMLDMMGFDCLSAIDYSKEEYELVKKMAELDNSQLGTSSGIGYGNVGKIRQEVLGTYDEKTQTYSKVKEQDRSAWMNETYVDKVTGDVTGAKKYENLFKKRRDNSDYFVEKRKHTGKGAYVSAGHGSGGGSSSGGNSSTSASDGSYNGTTSVSDNIDQTMISNTNTSDMSTDSQKASNETSSREKQTDNIKSVNFAEFNKIVEQIAKENYCSETIAVGLAMKKYSVVGMNKNSVLEHFRQKEQEQLLD